MSRGPATVVITGSTRGIGRGLAECFAGRGCNVVVNGRDPARVARLVGGLGGGSVVGRAADVTDPADLRALWEIGVEMFGSIDHWINNAALAAPRVPIWEQSDDDLASVVATNLTAALLASRLAIAEMRSQGRGTVWNVEGFGSTGRVEVGMTAHGATKRAIRYLHDSLVAETRGEPVDVGVISPGIVVTDLSTGGYDVASKEWDRARRRIRILGDRVETVAPWITEQVLTSAGADRRVEWMTRSKAVLRYATAFARRDVLA